ncbi:hypothetical protein SLH46_14595 [Draconibacterium sp. IB214405]|uniref:hypothetical protein n=1 Tax=Draconibacterium sp. IB214405 TaxID=3097352 RepID=UPI002A0D91BF|nr:hypothetical protein [Draconibacterium sp. IB214405]MDX8340428.1 hypothetical protein [Draconibacterium sp. IB214405]
MKNNDKLLFRAVGLYIIFGLLLAWCLVGKYSALPWVEKILPGNPHRILQGHLDFLLMSALILGASATRVRLSWHIRWSMVIGAFTNSSSVIVFAMFPSADPGSEAYISGLPVNNMISFLMRISFIITTYGFGGAAICIFLSTFEKSKLYTEHLKNNDILLLRAAGLYLIIALILAWTLIGKYNGMAVVEKLLPGNPHRILQTHIGFLLGTALILGIAAAPAKIAWHIRWALVIGAFTNTNIFLSFAMFPVADPGSDAYLSGLLANEIFGYFTRVSFVVTTYGFVGSGVSIVKSTFSGTKTNF